jgi:hypothetical protein
MQRIYEIRLALQELERLGYACPGHVPNAEIKDKIARNNTDIKKYEDFIVEQSRIADDLERQMIFIDFMYDLPTKEKDWKGMVPGAAGANGLEYLKKIIKRG